MQRQIEKKTNLQAAMNLAELTFHSIVRDVRKAHRNAIVGLLLAILQAVTFVAIFYILMQLMGMRHSAIRGDYMIYIMSGIFFFLSHNKALGAVVSASTLSNTILAHSPLNSIVMIASAALGALYIQTLALLTILFLYHVLITPVVIDDPTGALIAYLLAWISGVANGLVLLALTPWFPNAAKVIRTIYMRANMITSGKMFLGNMLPGYLLQVFSWNPLFHTIDQGRGYIFINYNPYNSSIWYPVWWTLIFIVIGMMAEFYTRQYASQSWNAGR